MRFSPTTVGLAWYLRAVARAAASATVQVPIAMAATLAQLKVVPDAATAQLLVQELRERRKAKTVALMLDTARNTLTQACEALEHIVLWGAGKVLIHVGLVHLIDPKHAEIRTNEECLKRVSSRLRIGKLQRVLVRHH